MGKTYLVEEIDIEDGLATFIAGIVGIGLVVLINYVIFQSLGENILHLGNLEKIDSEVLGILIGIFLSACVGTFVFIYKWMEGIMETVETSGKVMLYTTAIFTIVGSIVVPALLYFKVNETLDFEWLDLLKTLFFNTIFLLIATPLVTLCQLIVVTLIGTVISFIVYKILYFIKSFRITKTTCFKKILEFNQQYDLKGHTWFMKLYEDGIQFFDMNKELQKTISFKRLGYSNLKPLMRLTLVYTLSRKLKIRLKVINKEDSRCTSVPLVIYNCHVSHKLQNGESDLKKQERRYQRKNQKIERKRKREEHKQYKRKVKAGKDW